MSCCALTWYSYTFKGVCQLLTESWSPWLTFHASSTSLVQSFIFIFNDYVKPESSQIFSRIFGMLYKKNIIMVHAGTCPNTLKRGKLRFHIEDHISFLLLFFYNFIVIMICMCTVKCLCTHFPSELQNYVFYINLLAFEIELFFEHVPFPTLT
jgi:hypothetical protein